MRKINYIVVHCTATPPNTTVESIKRFWKDVRGWGDTPGYHYLIMRDGEVKQLLDESKISYGAYGHNQECIHVSYNRLCYIRGPEGLLIGLAEQLDSK